MKEPLTLEVDVKAGAAYVGYGSAVIAETRDVWNEGVVAADMDREGDIVGIEVLDLATQTLQRARAYAQEHELVFPANRDFGL